MTREKKLDHNNNLKHNSGGKNFKIYLDVKSKLSTPLLHCFELRGYSKITEYNFVQFPPPPALCNIKTLRLFLGILIRAIFFLHKLIFRIIFNSRYFLLTNLVSIVKCAFKDLIRKLSFIKAALNSISTFKKLTILYFYKDITQMLTPSLPRLRYTINEKPLGVKEALHQMFLRDHLPSQH